MLSPLHDPDYAAVQASQEARAAMKRIQEKMASQQKGEAFYDIGPPGSLAIPAFLRRRKGDPPDRTPLPEWMTKLAAKPASNIGKSKAEPTALELEILAAAEAEHEALTIGQRMAKKAMKKKDAEDKYIAHTRSKRKGEDVPAAAEPVDHTGKEWDAASGKWRTIGYMSPAKYQRLLAGMPDDKHRAVFIKMFGATQKPESRELPPAPTKKATAPRKGGLLAKLVDATAKPSRAATAPGAKRERKLNPEHDAKVSAMLRRPEGATLPEIGAAMGWQNHSASAFLTGIRKTRTIVKADEARGTVYRLKEDSK